MSSQPEGGLVLTSAQIRSEVAQTIGVEPASIGNEENLVLLGMGSLEMMRLVNRWRREGLEVDFAVLAGNPTLQGWNSHLCPDEVG